MEDNYPKAYKEVMEILNFVPKKSIDKIPIQIVNMFKAKMDKEYDFNIDLSKNFEEQNLLDETKAILANIFRDYWAIPYQKERIEEKEKYDRQKIEEEKRNKYNPNEIFNNRNIKHDEIEININLPAITEKESFYQKLIKFIKKIFHMGV